MHRLGEYFEIVTLRLSLLKQSAGVVIPRDEENLTFGKKFADFNRGLNAVHLRHHDTCHEEFELKAPGKFYASFTAVHSPRLKSIRIQHHGDCVRYCYIVIDNECERVFPIAVGGWLGKVRLREGHGY